MVRNEICRHSFRESLCLMLIRRTVEQFHSCFDNTLPDMMVRSLQMLKRCRTLTGFSASLVPPSISSKAKSSSNDDSVAKRQAKTILNRAGAS